MTSPATHEHQLPIARRHLADAIHLLAGRQRLTVDRDTDPAIDTAHAHRDHAAARRAATAAYHRRLSELDLLDLPRVLATTQRHRATLADLQRRHEESIIATTARTSWTTSRYQQLDDALISPTARSNGGSHIAGSQPPLWIDALDLRREIITHVTEWRTTWHLTGHRIIDQLHALADRAWRPQDVPAMTTIATTCTRWAGAIDTLFDPPRKLSLAAPCPACQVATVYRPDDTGEYVRQAALTITDRGCECLNCRHLWTPDLYRHLATVIGCATPEGVLE